ncbi:HCLS1-associated protein X-1 isoform X4 [Pogoniulus pusillus]|uniref:HCLS1-associated protein X-1 isoform X4 n=1 Tax=Pogoniulus pusillus TaxID=488313 RepID=UPI0030B98294
MNFPGAFGGFFGFPGRGRPRDPLFGGAAWDEEEEEEDDDSPGLAQPPRDFGFGPGGSRGAFAELFRDMSELLGGLGGAWAGPFEPSLPGAGAGAGAGGPGRSLRDSMLKHPESSVPDAAPGGSAGTGESARPWGPFPGLEGPHLAPAGPKEDQGLGTILCPEEPKCQSYFQSVSVTRVTLPDGAVQERRTVQDSSGHRQTTVTRRSGHQAFVSTTREDGQGKQCQEQVVNMDDRELAQFMGTWAQQEELQGPNLSSSTLGTFFRRWFSGW